METKKLFEKYYGQLRCEGILKSLIAALIVGFVVNFLLAFGLWFADFKGLWISIVASVVVVAAATPLFYFYKFKPTTKMIAKRVDRLGLEERLITMAELMNDDSYIALRQREDARESLAKLSGAKLKLKFSVGAIVAACIVGACGVTMTTIEGLAEANIIGSGQDMIDGIQDELRPSYTVEYEVQDMMGGEILGNIVQVVKEGDDAETVIAVADVSDPEALWVFVSWSDENTNPERTDTEITSNMKFYAIFQQVEPGDGESGEGEGEGEGEPSEEPSEGEPGEGEGDPSDFAPPSDSEGSGAGGSDKDEGSMIVDGNTPYEEVLKAQQYYDQAMEYVNSGREIPDWLKEIIKNYYGIIK